MSKTKKYCYGFCLLISIAVNILLIINLYVGSDRQEEKKQEFSCPPSLTWTVKAAAEAEEVAAISCSGHGRAYVDGLTFEGQPVCECYDCYGGTDCSELSPECVADADSGDPVFLEPFWMQHAIDSTVVISGWHRMSYQYADHTTTSKELENYIRKLYSLVGNAVTKGRYLVFGIGSTQLLNAAMYALSSGNSSMPSNVLASIPFYPMYKEQTMFFNSKDFEFEGDTNSWQLYNSTNNMDVVEFVTSPNNPDGELKKPALGGKTIYDHAYFWPHFAPIPGPSDHDLMIFTLSKLTGHAGTRFGYVYAERIHPYVQASSVFLESKANSKIGLLCNFFLRALTCVNMLTHFFLYNNCKEHNHTHESQMSFSLALKKLRPTLAHFFLELIGAYMHLI